ncbi:MAG: hypothetical protein KF851_10430 [Pirellulaceae bacterium]|nr:hypothetical protein [Pirellulaceae bacterium]
MQVPENEISSRVKAYCRSVSPTIRLSDRLGFGQDGYVWATNRDTAIKGLAREENYTRERNCYQRLAELGISNFDEFSIPNLISFDDSLLVIEMSIVFPPFLIDFGKSYLDHPPDFDSAIMDEFWRSRKELFEADEWKKVCSLVNSLESIGIFYFDVKPDNIRFS